MSIRHTIASADDIRFGKNTAVNHGLFVKGFHDLAAARDGRLGP